LNSSPAFTSTCVRGGLASFPGQRNVSCRGVGKSYISRRSGAVSALNVDS